MSVSPAPRQATAPTTDPQYDDFSMWLHWLTALLVVALWILGQIRSYFPKGAPRDAVLSVHIVCGLLLAAVLVVRIVWRSSAGRRLPLADPGWQGRLAQGAHLGLYVLLVVTVVLGLSRGWLGADHVFDWFAFHKPAFAVTHVTHLIGGLHGDLADIVIILAGLHALAALGHHYLRRDTVLQRMLPRKP